MTQKREPFFDNAKFILMYLVIATHLLQPFITRGLGYEVFYYVIFLFHMPAFIMISGYFSKNYQRKDYLKKLFKKLIVPYLCFQAIYSLFYYVTGLNDNLVFSIFEPEWSLWFLLSLFFWNAALFVFRRFKAQTALGAALLLGLLVGYIPWIDQQLSLSRTFVFFPFFLLGHYMTSYHFHWMRQHMRRIAPALFIGVALFIAINPWLNKYWFFGSQPYEDFLAVPALGAIVRLLIYFLSVLTAFAFFAWVPRRQAFYTKWGQNTITAYLLQGFIVKGLRAIGVSSWTFGFGWFLLWLVAAFVLTSFLASGLVENWRQQLLQRLKGRKERAQSANFSKSPLEFKN